eukprot:5295622-Amphidinium_carterae.1
MSALQRSSLVSALPSAIKSDLSNGLSFLFHTIFIFVALSSRVAAGTPSSMGAVRFSSRRCKPLSRAAAATKEIGQTFECTCDVAERQKMMPIAQRT